MYEVEVKWRGEMCWTVRQSFDDLVEAQMCVKRLKELDGLKSVRIRNAEGKIVE